MIFVPSMHYYRVPSFIQRFFYRYYWRMAKNEKSIYLTFDDGPGAEHSEWILSFLREQNIKATFFCVGEASRNNPLILNKIISEGHRIGNHTMREEGLIPLFFYSLFCTSWIFMKKIAKIDSQITPIDGNL